MITYCPCGADLTSEADKAHHVCSYCRGPAKKRAPRRRRVKPDFVDQPLPGLESWGVPT